MHLTAGLITTAASVFVALGVLWRYIIRPMVKAWRKISLEVDILHDLAQRELTHNGGSSLKDAVHRIDRTVQRHDDQLDRTCERVDETHDAVEALAQVMDHIVERKQEDHDALWEAVRRLGGEPPGHSAEHTHRRANDH